MLSHAFLLQHILSTRHRDFVSNSRNNVSANSLMERFLQDVIQHHPYRYNDSRPNHADLPSLNLPLVPKEELSDVYCLPEDERETVGTREEMPSTDDESGPVILVKEVKSTMDNRQNERKALQTHKYNISSVPGSTMPTEDLKKHSFSSVTVESNSPTQGFLHRTSSNTDSSLSENLLSHNQPCSSQAAQNPSVSRRSAVVANCGLKADINTELLKHNNNLIPGTAVNILPAIKHISAGPDGPSFTISTSSAFGIPKHHSEQFQGEFADSQSYLRNMTGACSSQRACAVGHPGTVMKIHSKEDQGYNIYKGQVLQDEDTVGETIEVIRKHYYSIPNQETPFEDETTSSWLENDTVRDAVLTPAVGDGADAYNSSNSSKHTVEREITFPSRLIYYRNEDSESTYHNLNTRARNQQKQNQPVSAIYNIKQIRNLTDKPNYTQTAGKTIHRNTERL
ncbi:UNVERIFIED_CONTAM: hypothetical protein FKN15_077431 [Acipenser sinensis]